MYYIYCIFICPRVQECAQEKTWSRKIFPRKHVEELCWRNFFRNVLKQNNIVWPLDPQMANYSALTFQDAWHHEICTLDHTSVCYVSLSKYLHMMPFWRQPDHYISRFYGDSTLQKLDAVTPDGDTAHHKKTIESEKLRASQNHNDTSKGCKLVAQPRPLLFSRHALCSRRSQRTGTDVCHCNSHIEKTWSR